VKQGQEKSTHLFSRLFFSKIDPKKDIKKKTKHLFNAHIYFLNCGRSDFEDNKNMFSIKIRFSKTMDLLDCEFLSGKINCFDYQVNNFV
jgi:hypothetical protein